ncbi:type VII toxin-antitoxin system HepT family RNase toxin [Melioribacter sp. OK-6-Me]|uniref:type VII toxin-antitoxin system HepT family RNase toxin n=1 Tax=unclassified Melioribacter TaxID=2627329 RepID=UPI003ED90038
MEKEQIQKKVTEFLRGREEVIFAYIFGSFVNKEFYHDVDVAVYLADNFDKNDLMKFPYGYESEMISQLNILVRENIDFIVMNNAELYIQKKIINEGILLFSKCERKRIYYENYIRKIYIDAANLRNIRRRYLIEKLIMPDLEIIEKHISSFIEDLENLKKHRNVTVDELKKDKDLLWILERGIYLLIQNLFDMLSHIISADFNEKWDYYTDISELLYNHNIISEDDKILLNKMAGYRNRLSHEYMSLDLNILTDIVNNRLSDFSRFLSIIKNYCNL